MSFYSFQSQRNNLRASLDQWKVEKEIKKVISIYPGTHKLSLNISHFSWAPQTFISHHYLIYLYFPSLPLTLNSHLQFHFSIPSNQTNSKDLFVCKEMQNGIVYGNWKWEFPYRPRPTSFLFPSHIFPGAHKLLHLIIT